MKIKMTRTENGSIDGIKVNSYEAGREYDLTRTAGERELAKAFVGARMAVEVVEQAPVPPDVAAADKEKAIEAAPENKAIEVPINNRLRKIRGK